jgi:GTP-binding protein Era
VVEKAGQKAIIIGAKGARLKEIGTQARLELEQILGRKLYLELFVKVRKDWREKPVYLREIDWRN